MTFIARPVGIYAVPSLALSQRSQLEHLIGLGGDLGTVRHDDHALALRMRQILENPHDVILRGEVEVAGGFVGQDNLWIVAQRAGDGHTLLLTA